jgi:hypothetical protein
MVSPNIYQTLLPFVFWILGLFLIALFYYSFHKARVFGRLGPQFIREFETDGGKQGFFSCSASCFRACRKDTGYRPCGCGTCSDACCEKLWNEEADNPSIESPYFGHISYKAIVLFQVQEFDLKLRKPFKRILQPCNSQTNLGIDVNDGKEKINGEQLELLNIKDHNPISILADLNTQAIQPNDVVPSPKPKVNGNKGNLKEMLDCQSNNHIITNGQYENGFDDSGSIQENGHEKSPELPIKSSLTNGHNQKDPETSSNEN